MEKKFAVLNSAGISIQYFATKQEAEQKAEFWREYQCQKFFVKEVA